MGADNACAGESVESPSSPPKLGNNQLIMFDKNTEQ
jgi:hypothetical protein